MQTFVVTCEPMRSPTRLRCEHLEGPVLGTDVRRPRLSWWLPTDSVRQTAYEIALDDRRHAKIDSAESVLVPWPFDDLRSRDRIEWRVRSWLGARPSAWSEPSVIEVGLLDPTDWQASWIEPVEVDSLPPGRRPAWIFRHDFSIEKPAQRSRLYATAHGIYETFLNGRRVGDLEFTPGFTSYPSSLQVQTFDIDHLLLAGKNRWEVVLSDGWYRGMHGDKQRGDGFGETVAFLGQLEAGSLVVSTGADWEATTGPIVSADLMAGQVEDRRRAPGPWSPVATKTWGFDNLTTSPCPPVRAVQEIPPVTIRRLDEDVQIVDLGQNITGRLRLATVDPEGTTYTLTYGEALDEHGDVTFDHLTFGQDGRVPPVDQVTLGDRDDGAFEPRHTLHGFQYARIEGHRTTLTSDDVTGVVTHTDLRRTGWFRCSNDRINRLREIADWSFRDNACDIPTDCPHRERSGWTGDWQIFAPTAAEMYDVAGFSIKWLRDLAAEQLPGGLLGNYAPDPRRRVAVANEDLTWYGLMGSSGWGDACVLVPWEIYRRYGDVDVLDELWPTMLRWLDFAATSARTKRHPSRVEKSPAPRPHERYLWDGGWHWGEWCEPETDGEPWWSADQGHVGTAYLHLSARRAADIGRVLGHDAEAERLAELAGGALNAWRAEYLDASGSISPDTQAAHVRALAFDLVPDELRARTAGRLVDLIRAAGTHLGTGFLATPYLLPVLADSGHLDVAFDLLLQDSPPSWLTMVDRGATTVWEEWEGIDADGVAHASLNHYSKGAVVSFLHRYVAGIQQVDGHVAFRRFRIAPTPGGGVTWAEGALETPHGRIESRWRLVEGRFDLAVTVPPGTEAEVILSDGTSRLVGPGAWEYSCPTP